MSNSAFWMTAKRDGKCAECEGDINQGERMVWDRDARKGYCGTCGPDTKAGADPAAEDENF
jgi:hypothetical protein